METIQSVQSKDESLVTPVIYFAAIIIIFGINLLFSFLRPIMNLSIMYFEINWAAFQILEIFDILALIFGLLLILFGFCLFYYQKFSRTLLYFGGMVFFLYNLIDPSHFLMLGSLVSTSLGNPPVWITAIPGNLLGIYLSFWSVLSISHILLQFIGFYVAIRITFNSQPQQALLQFLFFYCWVIALSGLVLCLQSILITSLTASWTSLSILSYILHFASWISMSLVGITGLFFIIQCRKNQPPNRYVKFGQLALISFATLQMLISFSDIAMKSLMDLVLTTLLAIILIFFAFRLPIYLKKENQKDKS